MQLTSRLQSLTLVVVDLPAFFRQERGKKAVDPEQKARRAAEVLIEQEFDTGSLQRLGDRPFRSFLLSCIYFVLSQLLRGDKSFELAAEKTGIGMAKAIDALFDVAHHVDLPGSYGLNHGFLQKA